MKILVTGGTGYIGSHTVVQIIQNGDEPILLGRSNPTIVESIKTITGVQINTIVGDILDTKLLDEIFAQNHFDAVIHFAGAKSVKESLQLPLCYYQNNVVGTMNLLMAMQKHNCKRLIFSSSCTVYGEQKEFPIAETATTGIGITTPYGKSKYMVEEILKDLSKSDNTWSIGILRYFNPIGSHESGLLDENPKGLPNNLFPYLVRVGQGLYKELKIFGNDYEGTTDGTCMRDYIHVEDLVTGHLACIQKLMYNRGLYIYNLGSGIPTSILELIHAFEKVNKVKIPFIIGERRLGDTPILSANVEKAQVELGWMCRKTLEEMCKIVIN
jgi:UDP-glucose 4-epimerase